jgi:hypothetical protein
MGAQPISNDKNRTQGWTSGHGGGAAARRRGGAAATAGGGTQHDGGWGAERGQRLICCR